MYTKDQIRAMLPQVGDVRMETPTIIDKVVRQTPQRCVVTYVNREHLWYRVRFANGLAECYKMPKVKSQNEMV